MSKTDSTAETTLCRGCGEEFDVALIPEGICDSCFEAEKQAEEEYYQQQWEWEQHQEQLRIERRREERREEEREEERRSLRREEERREEQCRRDRSFYGY